MSFLGEIKRRKVFQVAAVYLVVAWLIMQVVDVIDEPLRVPEWFATVVILLLAIGFPIALILSWVFEITPDGVARDPSDAARHGGRTVEYVLIGVLGCALAWVLVTDDGSSGQDQPTATTALANSGAAEPAIDFLPNGIAILPFENMSVDPEDEFFAAGIHDEIISQVAKIQDLNVIARTSVMQYEGARRPITEIARELRVANVLEGSVSHADDRVRIRAQLIDGTTGAHLWSEVFRADITDVFEIYADISERIANSLEAELLPRERERIAAAPTSSPVAYALYLSALEAKAIDRGLGRSMELLDRAIESDGEFALAHAWKANLLGFQFVVEVTEADRDPSRSGADVAERLQNTVIEHAQRALEIDPTLGVAHAALGHLHMRNWRRAETEEAFARALAVSPKDAEVLRSYGLFSSWIDDHERAQALAERADSLDPLQQFLDVFGNLYEPYFWSGDLNFAVTRIETAVAANPINNFLRLHLAEAETARGNYSIAVEHLMLFEELSDVWFQGSIARAAYVYSLGGRTEAAARVVALAREQSTPPSATQSAFGALALRDEGEALRLLREAAEFRLPAPGATITMMVKNNVYGDPVLDQPEFVEVRERLGFRE